MQRDITGVAAKRAAVVWNRLQWYDTGVNSVYSMVEAKSRSPAAYPGALRRWMVAMCGSNVAQGRQISTSDTPLLAATGLTGLFPCAAV